MDIRWDKVHLPQDVNPGQSDKTFWLADNDRRFTLAAAICLHSVLVVSLALYAIAPAPKKPQKSLLPINARLITPDLIYSVQQPQDAREAGEEAKDELRKSSVSEQQLNNDKSAPFADESPTQLPEKKSAFQPPPLNNAPAVKADSTIRKPERNSAPPVSASSALNNYFSRHDASQISELGKADSRRARYQQRHPSLTDPRKGEPEQEVSEVNVHKIRCDGTSGKIVATFSGWVGGTLRCSSDAQLAPHINKRLEDAGVKRQHN